MLVVSAGGNQPRLVARAHPERHSNYYKHSVISMKHMQTKLFHCFLFCFFSKTTSSPWTQPCCQDWPRVHSQSPEKHPSSPPWRFLRSSSMTPCKRLPSWGVRDRGSSPHTLGRRHWASSLGSVSSGKTAVGPALYLQGCSEITGTDFPTRSKHAWLAAIYYVTINW